MKVLIIKTSSLGDIIHTLPAVTDAAKAIPHVQFDWVVEENFVEVPKWHPCVNKVIPVALRRWRKNLWQTWRRDEWKKFLQTLQSETYDYVIDAQGLLKSAFLTYFANGTRCGLDKNSAWESLAAIFYQQNYTVDPSLHAVTRVRELFAQALNYSKPNCVPNYGVDISRLTITKPSDNYVVFLHGTTWTTKHWPETYWQALAKKVITAGYKVYIPWGNAVELERAQQIATNASQIEVLPKLNLTKMANVLVNAKAAVAVDTGLGHLAAALAVPTVSLYGPTDPQQTGALGANQIHLAAEFPCAPCLQTQCTYTEKTLIQPACFTDLSPTKVWQTLQTLLMSKTD